MNRVVITGVGVISPVGNTKEEFFKNVVEGNHGIKEITGFDTENFKVKLAAEIRDFNPENFGIERKEARKMDRFCQFALAATKLAIKDSSIDLATYDPYKVGCILGSGIGGLHTLEAEHTKLIEKGPSKISPFMIPMLISNMAAATISMEYKIKGSSYSMATACASSTDAIGEAYKSIKHGYMDACIVGGAEAVITPLAMSGFANMKALSTATDPNRASIPFDKERSGFVMGEGSGILILETYDNAVKRGAKIYGEVAGYGATNDAYHMTSPDPDGLGAIESMRLAIKDANLEPQNVDYINAHGTSTEINDKTETMAIKKLLGDKAKDVLISSTKGVTGHMLGAAGAIEAIICSLAITEGIVPPTANYKVPDENCDLNYVPNNAIKKEINVAISNSLGFGGHNGTILIKKV